MILPKPKIKANYTINLVLKDVTVFAISHNKQITTNILPYPLEYYHFCSSVSSCLRTTSKLNFIVSYFFTLLALIHASGGCTLGGLSAVH